MKHFHQLLLVLLPVLFACEEPVAELALPEPALEFRDGPSLGCNDPHTDSGSFTVDGMPSVEQRVTLGRCEVNNVPMFQWSGEGWKYVQVDGQSSLGIPSDVFAAPPGHAVGIDIPPFSDLMNKATLEFSVRNDNPHPVRVCIEAYGEIQQPPQNAVGDSSYRADPLT
jgi:hypothetical protein